MEYFILLRHKLSKFKCLYLQLINQFNAIDDEMSYISETSKIKYVSKYIGFIFILKLVKPSKFYAPKKRRFTFSCVKFFLLVKTTLKLNFLNILIVLPISAYCNLVGYHLKNFKFLKF